MVARHADSITMDHIIELRREILKLEKRLERQDQYIRNTSEYAVKMRNENADLRKQLDDLTSADDSEFETDLAIP